MKEELDCFLMLRNFNYTHYELIQNIKSLMCFKAYVLIATYIVYIALCIWNNNDISIECFGCIKMAEIKLNSKDLYKKIRIR